MSVNRNIESVAEQGEFHARVPRDEPLTTKGHAPGVLVGNDAQPEFHAEAHAPGTAPPDATFRPNNISETPGQNRASEQSGTKTSASASLPGATSADVHQGVGLPGSGMTSQELHGGKGKKERSGLEGVGTSAVDPQRERRFDVGVEPDSRGKTNPENMQTAEERWPATAEEVSAERNHERRK